MIYVFLALFIITSFTIILKYPEIGIVSLIVVPIIKDLFLLPVEKIPLLNLLFLFTIFTVFSTILKYSTKINIIKIDKNHLIALIIFTAVLIISLLYTNKFKYGSEKIINFMFFNILYFMCSVIIFQDIISFTRFFKMFRWIILFIAIFNTILLIKSLLEQER